MPDTKLRFLARTVLPYAAFAALWIYLSDRMLAALVADPALLTRLQTYKGLVFILITTLLLYWLLRRELGRRERAESERRRLHARILEILESITDGFVALDNYWRYLYVNRRAAEMFGRKPEDLIGRNIWTEFPEGVNQPLCEACHKAMAEQASITIEDYYAPWDRWFEYRIFPSPDTLYVFSQDITARRRSEKVLHETNKLLDSIIEHIPDMIFVKDVQSLRFVRFNQAGEALLGYSREELIGKSDHDIFPKAQADFFTANDRQVLKDGNLVDIAEEPLQTRCQGTRILHTKKIPICDETGKPIYLLGISEDITEHKKAEETLHASEARIRLIFEQASDTIMIISADNRFLDVNPRGLEMLGYTREEFLRLGVADIIVPDEHPRLGVEPAEMMAGKPHLAEWLHRRKDGSTFPGEVSARKLNDDSYLAIVRDLTERRRAEAALHESERRFRATLENVQLLAVGLDTEGNINFCNDFLLALTGWQREDVLGRHWFRTFLPESVREPVWQIFQQAIATDNLPLNYENEITTRAGDLRLIKWNNTVLHDPDGKIIGTVSLGEDITERRHAQEALQQSEQRLRDLIDGLGPHNFVGLLTPEGVIVEANRSALTAAGLTPEDVQGKPVEETYWWSYSQAVQQQLREAVVRAARGEASRYDVQIRVGEGQFAVLDFSLQPMRDETGRIVFLVPSAVVITERKQAEAALREHEEVLRLFVEHSPAAIGMFDTDMHYVAVSRRWLSDYGLGDQNIVGRSHYEIFPEIPQRWKEDTYRRCLAGATERNEEDPFVRADGHTDWVKWEICPWNKADGSIGGIIVFSELVTAHKQAELKIAENAERLEHLSRQLLASQETERRHIAHELHDEIGQLLTVVKLDLQTVLRQPGTAALAPAVKEGMESIDRVVARVRDLSLDLRPSMLDDLGLLPTLRWYVQRQASHLGAGVEITLTLPPSLPRLPGTIETACFRVVQEALTNIARHAGAQRIDVTLDVKGHDIELTVHDNGTGFDVVAARRQTLNGAGFGLLGMQERAELAGGQLALVSAPGQGTTVHARFPGTTALEPTA